MRLVPSRPLSFSDVCGYAVAWMQMLKVELLAVLLKFGTTLTPQEPVLYFSGHSIPSRV